jgi:hypothetical protein
MEDLGLAGMTLVREHQQHLQTYQLWLAAAISRRSDHELGDGGLARRNGSATPRDLIQRVNCRWMRRMRSVEGLAAPMLPSLTSNCERQPSN